MATEAAYFAFQFLSAGALVGVAVWLFLLDPGRTLNRAFAFFLLVRGMRTIAASFALMVNPPLDVAYWATVRNHLDFAATGALAYFAVAYWAPRRRWAPAAKLAIVIAAAACSFLYAGDHCLESCTLPDGYHVGPFVMIRAASQIAMSLLGLLFAITWALDRVPAASRSTLFLSAGLALTPLLDSSAYVTVLIDEGFASVADRNGVGTIGVALAIGSTVPPALSLAAVVLWGLESRRQARDQAVVRRLLVIAAAVITSGVVAHFVQDLPPVGGFDSGAFAFFFIFGVWRLALPLFVIYALVRHHLFDLDWRLRIGLQRGTMATLALGVFFAGAQIIEGLLENYLEGFGQQSIKYAGAALLGLTVYLMYPLQRLVERFARRALPDPRPIGDLSGKERLSLYTEHAAIAWQDGVLSRKERILLDHLRSRLHLSADQTHAVEHQLATRMAGRTAVA